MFWFILLLLVIGTGFYLNSCAHEVERDIKALREQVYVPEKVELAELSVAVEDAPHADSGQVGADLLATRILGIVAANPGMKQTMLYPQLADVAKKVLQQQVKGLADGGRLVREKSGSSYLLYPCE
jgi:hypothetical protein